MNTNFKIKDRLACFAELIKSFVLLINLYINLTTNQESLKINFVKNKYFIWFVNMLCKWCIKNSSIMILIVLYNKLTIFNITVCAVTFV